MVRLRALVFALLLIATPAFAQGRLLSIRYTPTKRAQVAIWIEAADGTFLQTILLTEAVALRGIGNRPGAMAMNSGFRYPYGRREGVLPIWAYSRAAAPGASLFPRVIFQNRWEGYASRWSRINGVSGEDSSVDHYFCLSFDDAKNDDIDATTCASVFNSDKGRFITQTDVDAAYAEPFQETPGVTIQRPLSLTSLYPMRRDATGGTGNDGPDATALANVARTIMPDIDAVTRATAPASAGQQITFPVPDAWPDGDYVVFLEVNTEADFNDAWTEAMHPTPAPLDKSWDSWSTYGYAYRGQPSVVFRVPIHVSDIEATASAMSPIGYSELHGFDGDIRPLDTSMADDPAAAPGSGVDRLQQSCDRRIEVGVGLCDRAPNVSPVADLVASAVVDEEHSHEWADVAFTAVDVEGLPAVGYQVKVSTQPITNDTEFVQAEDAKATTLDYQGLDLCPIDATTEGCMSSPTCPPVGTRIAVSIGKLMYQTRYYVAVRAIGPCGAAGPITTVDFETSEIHFTTVSPCFVATAAFGSPLEASVDDLRRFRDDALMTNDAGRAFVDAYYAVGPWFADRIRDRPTLRTVARAVLRPLVQLGRLRDARAVP